MSDSNQFPRIPDSGSETKRQPDQFEQTSRARESQERITDEALSNKSLKAPSSGPRLGIDLVSDLLGHPPPESDGAFGELYPPAGWARTGEHDPDPDAIIGYLRLDEFAPINGDDAKLAYYNHGFMDIAYDEPIARLLASHLQTSPHIIEQQDWHSFLPVIGEGMYDPQVVEEKEDSLRISSLKIVSFKGKNVLELQGIYPLAQKRIFSLFAADDSGQYVDQIYYVAHVDCYEKYLPEMKASFERLQWRQM